MIRPEPTIPPGPATSPEDRLAAATAALSALLAGETARIAAGRLDAPEGEAAAKRAAFDAYAAAARDLEPATLAPEARRRLAALHAGLATAIETNLATLATARAVAEGLVQAFVESARRETGAGLYAPARAKTPAPVPARPIAYAARA